MYKYCGKIWTADDLEIIRALIAAWPKATRAKLSRLVCERFDWRKHDGKLKDMSCRVAMIRMQDDGLINLPKPVHPPIKPYQLVMTQQCEPKPALCCSVDNLKNLHMELVPRGPALRLWSEFVARYHYLGYKMLPGAQLRYFLKDDDQFLGMMGFGASAWKVAPRDNFIGWNRETREQRLHLIVNQSRFLILPWVNCRNLASKSLAMIAKRLPDDWERFYGYRPVLMETFVEISRFHGTCYKASNWLMLGHTQGRGKLDRDRLRNQPIKSIWVKPLVNDFRLPLGGNGT